MEVVGSQVMVPCVGGKHRRYIDLDSAASTPPLQRVAEAVHAFLPWYSSVHRGVGYKSRVATAAFDGARESVAAFVDARGDDIVIFVRNTTEAANVLSTALEPGSRVLSTPVEHHANMLPWRRHQVDLLPFTASPEALLHEAERALQTGSYRLLAVTGASNVTGEIWPIAELARIAHAADTEIFVDAAQLVPHRALSLRDTDVDYTAFSGHKLYAPYGAGALVGRKRALSAGDPMLRGGGAVQFVSLDDVAWSGPPARHEAGSPNTVGIVALGVACDVLNELGMDQVAAREKALSARLRKGLTDLEGIELLHLWTDSALDRVGVVTFVASGLSDRLLATILSGEYAIGVRDGCFCAHPLMMHLLSIPEAEARSIRAEIRKGHYPRMPGAVRASLSLASSLADVEYLLASLAEILQTGPQASYRYENCLHEFVPVEQGWLESPADMPFRLAGP